MAYTIPEIKARITAILAENHSGNIGGIILQELLIDLVDSLDAYAGGGGGSGDNYYVDSIAFDPATNVLTLGRAGGILPANLSIAITPGDPTVYRAYETSVGAGDTTIPFSVDLPVGTEYLVVIAGAYSDVDGADVRCSESNHTISGFDVNTDEACAVKWFIIQIQ